MKIHEYYTFYQFRLRSRISDLYDISSIRGAIKLKDNQNVKFIEYFLANFSDSEMKFEV